MPYSPSVLEGGCGISINIEKEARDMAFHMIVVNKGLKPSVERVVKII